MLENCNSSMDVMDRLVKVVRPQILKQLQTLRDQKVIAKSLEASVTLSVSALDLAWLGLIRMDTAGLAELFGVSQVSFRVCQSDESEVERITGLAREPRPWDGWDDGSHPDDGKAAV
jgi:hypothetical protein